MQVVKELGAVKVSSSVHPLRRMVVLLRDDGCYTFAEQYYFINEYDGEVIAKGWATLAPNGIYDTEEAAELDALATFARLHGLAN